MKNEIMKQTNQLIYLLIEFDDGEFVDEVLSRINCACFFEEDEMNEEE